jgi:ATP-dependent protease ClpP protease subunit
MEPTEAHDEFTGEITSESSRVLLARMVEHTYEGVDRVVLDVASPGGHVDSAIHLHNELVAARFEIVTRNVGGVASMANLVFLAGDKRLATPEATFLFHPIAFEGTVKRDLPALRHARTRLEGGVGHSRELGELDARIAVLDGKEREIRLILERRTGLSAAQIERLVADGRPISAAEALSAGIVHELIPPQRR